MILVSYGRLDKSSVWQGSILTNMSGFAVGILLLSHADELASHPYEITAIYLSYGGVIKPSI